MRICQRGFCRDAIIASTAFPAHTLHLLRSYMKLLSSLNSLRSDLSDKSDKSDKSDNSALRDLCPIPNKKLILQPPNGTERLAALYVWH